MTIGMMSLRLDRVEVATQPLIDGTPKMMCKPDLLSDVSCGRVTFTKSSQPTVNLPPCRLIYHDDANKLDRSRIEQAAQALVNRGAWVGIYTANNGGEDDIKKRLDQDRLSTDGKLNPTMIAIYVSINPRYSAIHCGGAWSAVFSGKNNYETIRQLQLNPGLVAGDFTAGFVNTIVALNQAMTSNR
jgi:hypothetical protein